MKNHLCKFALACGILAVSTAGFAQKSASIIMLESSLDDGRIVPYGMSPNGKWAALTAGSQGAYSSPILWNLEANERVLLLGKDDVNSSMIMVLDVDNNGMGVGEYDNLPAYFKDGEWQLLPMPEGCVDGRVLSVSADGSVMVGQATNGGSEDRAVVYCCKWVNYQLTTVNLPDMGYEINQCRITDVSADGKIVFGSFEQYAYPFNFDVVAWTTEPQRVCEDLYLNEAGERNLTMIDRSIPIAVSVNGQYVVGGISCDDGSWGYDACFSYDLKTKKTTLYEGKDQETLAFGTAVDNNGVIYECPNVGMAIRDGYIRINGAQHDLFEYLKNEYNFDAQADGLLQKMGTALAVSEDCKTVLGFEGPGRNWCLKYSVAPGQAESAIEAVVQNKVTVSMNGNMLVVGGNADYVTITDLAGKVVKKQALNGTNVDLAGLPKGIYVAIVSAEGQNVVRKIAVK